MYPFSSHSLDQRSWAKSRSDTVRSDHKRSKLSAVSGGNSACHVHVHLCAPSWEHHRARMGDSANTHRGNADWLGTRLRQTSWAASQPGCSSPSPTTHLAPRPARPPVLEPRGLAWGSLVLRLESEADRTLSEWRSPALSRWICRGDNEVHTEKEVAELGPRVQPKAFAFPKR